jgi:predicted transcriptional regulator
MFAEAEEVSYRHERDTSRIGPSGIAVNLSRTSVDIAVAKLYLRDMQSLPIKSERLAELEEFARRRGKSTADALDDALAEYLEWERQDYQEALEGIRQGLEDVKAGRTKPADEFLDDFARKHGLPR